MKSHEILCFLLSRVNQSTPMYAIPRFTMPLVPVSLRNFAFFNICVSCNEFALPLVEKVRLSVTASSSTETARLDELCKGELWPEKPFAGEVCVDVAHDAGPLTCLSGSVQSSAVFRNGALWAAADDEDAAGSALLKLDGSLM
mmetsp:Transcript_156073/g.500562  ORF Transcript_156073/g.500562 Transcript_156073/m.500562 type:complete len:143 (+) Transcript_156073:1430-1858(+)